jgi:hypothetical protein
MRKPALLLIVLLILVVALAVVLNLIWGPFGRVRAGLAEERQLHRLEGGAASCFQDVRPIPAERNAASLYERTGAARDALPESVLLGLDDRNDPVVRSRAVRDAAPAIALAHQAMARPGFFIEVDTTTSDPFLVDPFMPYLGPARGIARLLEAEAQVLAQAGQPGSAVRVLAEAMRTYDHLNPYPDPIIQLVLFAIDEMLLDAFETIGTRADAESLTAVDEALAKRDWMASAREHLLVERELTLSTEHNQGTPRERLVWLQANREAIESLDEPYHQNPVPAELPVMYLTSQGTAYRTPHPLQYVRFAAIMQTRTNLARSAIALRRHSLEHGDYPDDYEALTDLFTGEPLSYEKTAAGFILRSAGERLDGSPLEWAWEESPSEGP